METSPFSKIMDLALTQAPRPFDRLVKGKPILEGQKAVAALLEKEAGRISSLPLIQAALYLYFDCFEEAHNIANEHEGTPAGNWVHAILHRREPDASNSKYWYARVKAPGKAFKTIGRQAAEFLKKQSIAELDPLLRKLEKSGSWEPENFVDLCEQFRLEEPQAPACRVLAGIQEIEWRGLAEYILKS